MKSMFLGLAFFTALISCSNKISNDGESVNIVENNHLCLSKYQNALIGCWTVNAHVYWEEEGEIRNETEKRCNVCPKICFKSDGSGELINPSNQVYLFRYKIESAKISFLFDSQKDKEGFISNDFDFSYSISKKGDGEVCELSNKSSKSKFILGRGK